MTPSTSKTAKLELTPAQRRFLFALAECPKDEEGIRTWIRTEADNGAAANYPQAFVAW